jgi:hypothetical protein
MTATTVFYLQYYGKMIEAKLAYTTNSQQLHKVIVMRVLRDIYQSRNSSILRSNSPMSQLFSSPDWVKQKTIKLYISGTRRVSDCLAPTQQLLLAIAWREQVNFQ